MENSRANQILEQELQDHRALEKYNGIAAIALAATSSIPLVRSAIENSPGYNGVGEMVVTAVGLGLSALFAHKSIVEGSSADALEQVLDQQD